MPVEGSQKNPRDGSGVYFPGCRERLFAYHGVAARATLPEKQVYVYEMYEVVATEEAFRSIWKEGFLYSHAERVARGEAGPSSMIFGMDKVAGDDEFVFLNICKPHGTGRIGYHFVFDPYQLVDNGAQIGLWDLQSFYMNIAERLEVKDRNDDTTWTDEQVEQFVEDAEFVKSIWRVSDGEAITWLRWIQGVLRKSPVNANALRYVARVVGDIGYHNIRWAATDRDVAARRSELLMPKVLPLELLAGVIFRKQWIEIDDFIRYYGPPGTEPPPAIEVHDALQISDSVGHPAKCSRCGGWIDLEPLEIKKSSWSSGYPWKNDQKCPGIGHPITILVCKSCGGAFGRREKIFGFNDDPFKPEEYICQYEECKYVSPRW